MRCTFHGAASHRDVNDSAPLRQTIEVRLLALYDKEANKASRVRRFQSEIPPENPVVESPLGKLTTESAIWQKSSFFLANELQFQ